MLPRAPADSCSKPTSILVPPVPVAVFADVSAFRGYTPPARSNSIHLPVASWKIDPPELRKTMMLPRSATCPTGMIDLCNPVVLGAIWRSPDTLTSSRVRMKLFARPDVVNRCPVADLSSTQSDKVCWHTDVAAPASIRNSFLICFTTRHIEHPSRGGRPPSCDRWIPAACQ